MSRQILPGWTSHLAGQRDVNRVTDTDIQAFFHDADESDFQAAMAELRALEQQIKARITAPHNPIRPAAPGEIHRDAFLATRTDLVGNLGLAADLGLQNPWPWDWARAQIVKWRRELDTGWVGGDPA